VSSTRVPADSPRGRVEPAELAGQRVLVMGLGSFGGGMGAARFLAQQGARVTVTDQRPASQLTASLAALADLPLEFVLGEHREADFEASDVVVVNPAVAPDHPLLAHARRHGARITSEIELFLERVTARLVCVTGTQGKSSTCHLVASLLSRAGIRAHLGGNFGGSLLSELGRIGAEDVVVLELSSYQLEALENPLALGGRIERVLGVAVVNVLADHLERHGTVAAYAAAKRRILDLLAADGVAVLPREDEWASRFAVPRGRRLDFSLAPGAATELCIEDGCFRLGSEILGRVADLRLPGTFQRANALVALGLARFLGAAPERLAAALGQIRGLAHRLESLGRRRGRLVLDNGVSTTPDSTISALRSLEPGICLLVGGRAKKGLALDELVDAARGRVALAVCYGEAREAFASALERAVSVARAAGLSEAVALAFERAPSGATVLFSPACSSFDAFTNFRARAEAFRAALPAEDASHAP
jgi:UDP-N-acetylmuramoylalanine--D-glutamate ligase